MVDRDTPSALIAVEPSLWQHITQAGRDALLLVRLWVGSATDSEAGEHTAWLHSNHLGAPELATDRQGQLIWQARYSPFGAAQVQQAKEGSEAAFVLHLRLPGQIFDPETGLHYNRQRYYDPQAGQYLTPDPLGTPDGPNPYAYVAFNPLTFIDPDGFILFAFDGTENDDPPMGGSAVSNVVRFRDVYDDGNRRYVSGVGTTHEDREWGDIDNVSLDAGVNRTGTRRIERMFVYLLEEARSAADNEVMQIDIVGFSRGAAQARDFANKIVAYRGASVTGDTFDFRADANGWLHYNATVVNDRGQRITFKGCQRVNFRFMGLWDTVLSTNSGRNYQLSIPAQFKHVAMRSHSTSTAANPLVPARDTITAPFTTRHARTCLVADIGEVFHWRVLAQALTGQGRFESSVDLSGHTPTLVEVMVPAKMVCPVLPCLGWWPKHKLQG